MRSRVEGLDTVLANINASIDDIHGGTQDGLWEAGLQIQRASQKALKASVITGNLRASGYTRKQGEFVRLDPDRLDDEKNLGKPTGKVNGVEVGYTALYALFVHENMEGRAPKFLESPLRDNEKAIVEIVRRRASV